MKRINFLALIMLIASLSVRAWGHEGHDHAPGAIAAPHGGIVKIGKDFVIELLQQDTSLKFYIFSHDMKSLPVGEINITATAQIPKKKVDVLKVEKGSDGFSSTYDAKGAYRYELAISIDQKGKKDLLKFQVEPRE